LRQRRLAELDGEAIPLVELVELALGNGEPDGLALVEIRQLVLRIPRLAVVVALLIAVVVISTSTKSPASSSSSSLSSS
jgi:hypothetical protein